MQETRNIHIHIRLMMQHFFLLYKEVASIFEQI